MPSKYDWLDPIIEAQKVNTDIIKEIMGDDIELLYEIIEDDEEMNF